MKTKMKTQTSEPMYVLNRAHPYNERIEQLPLDLPRGKVIRQRDGVGAITYGWRIFVSNGDGTFAERYDSADRRRKI